MAKLKLKGRHRVMCGDATNTSDVHELMAGDKADLLQVDPPYNVAYGAGAAFKNNGDGGNRIERPILNDDLPDEEFRVFLRNAFANASAVMRPGAAYYIWHADTEGFNFRGACRDVGWTVRQCLIWKKSSLVLGRQDYQWCHEPCLYGWTDGAAHHWASDRKQTTVLEYAKPHSNTEHPTSKPVEMILYQIENNARTNDIVCDLFGGSGTTLAAVTLSRLNLRARIMELSEQYCDVIVRRWLSMTGGIAVRESDGMSFDQMAECTLSKRKGAHEDEQIRTD